jgi:hypothetical protein
MRWQVKEQVAMLDVGLTSRLALTRPCSKELDAPPV